MDIRGWEERYRSRERSAEDVDAAPTPLLVETARRLNPGRALDLASGAGRNALWLAGHGWQVTAVDGAQSAIDILQDRARQAKLAVEAQVQNLQSPDLRLEPHAFDLVAICYYLQRSLFAPAKQAVKPGGTLLAIVHTTEDDEEPTASRLRPGKLRLCFEGWKIQHDYEGTPADPAHKRAVAEIVAQRPAN